MAKAQLKESQELVFQIRAKMTEQCQIRTQWLPGEARPEGRPQRLGGQALEAGERRGQWSKNSEVSQIAITQWFLTTTKPQAVLRN